MTKLSKQGGGGKLGRSETVTIRLDPQLNYLAEIAARSQRRTKSSLIEAALAGSLDAILLDPRPSAENRTTIAQVAGALWHVSEAERLRRLVEVAPHLMTFEEQKAWDVISKNAAFWFGFWQNYGSTDEYFSYDSSKPENLLIRIVEEHFDSIKAVAAGAKPEKALPQMPVFRKKQISFGALGFDAVPSNG